jgi:hypothetical protein
MRLWTLPVEALRHCLFVSGPLIITKMPGFFTVFNFLHRLSFIDTICLNLLLIGISLLSERTWSTWALGVIVISQSYIVTVGILSSPNHRYIGIQLHTTNALHTLAYQVLPIPTPALPSLAYQVSR